MYIIFTTFRIWFELRNSIGFYIRATLAVETNRPQKCRGLTQRKFLSLSCNSSVQVVWGGSGWGWGKASVLCSHLTFQVDRALAAFNLWLPRSLWAFPSQQKGKHGGWNMEVLKSGPGSRTHPFCYTPLEWDQFHGHTQLKGGWKTHEKQVMMSK